MISTGTSTPLVPFLRAFAGVCAADPVRTVLVVVTLAMIGYVGVKSWRGSW